MRRSKRKQTARFVMIVLSSFTLIYTSVVLIMTDNVKTLSLLKRKQVYEDTLEKVQLPTFVDSRKLTGPGEGGAAVYIDETNLTMENKTRFKDGWTKHHFNELASNGISVYRSLPDCRSEVCKKYVDNFHGTLPEISVVIIFHNEAWTTLLRTVYSILSRTPEHLLKKILLVDDNSTFDYLKAPLDKYFSSFPKVEIIHSPEKVGLTRARLLGFEATVSPVVVFFDSHIECFPGWAESILIRIATNPKAVVFPIIEDISDKTFQVSCSKDIYYYGSFDWKNLYFNWIEIPQRERQRRKDGADSYRSPTMPGGLFAISREFFLELGTYDPELDFWGGENIELSFKTWMCGGSLELDICSHVGHVFRKSTPVKGSSHVIFRNSIRVAEVWMDDYKNYFYERINFKLEDYGNITDRINLRKSLQCQSFDWYMKNVFPEKVFPQSMKFAGEIRSVASPKCFVSSESKNTKPMASNCQGTRGNQVWYMGDTAQIQQDDSFVCVQNNTLILANGRCQTSGPQWQYRENKTLYHLPTGQCLTLDATKDTVSVTRCGNTTWQKWEFQLRRTDLNFPVYHEKF